MAITATGKLRLDAAIEHVCAVFKKETGSECVALIMINNAGRGTFSQAVGIKREDAADLLIKFAQKKLSVT